MSSDAEEKEQYHVPVMVSEVLKFLNPGRGGLYFDGTLGGGGHSDAILSAGSHARVIGVDQDPEALEVAGQRLARYGDRVSLTLGPRANAQDKARIFQAVRVAVNDELSVLERALPALRDRLEDEGVLVVLSYHSLEDRMVKNEFREWSRECVCPPDFPVCRCRGRALGELLTKKPVNPSDAELQVNVRARSAHLRAWRKVA
jgi:16S rRNA C1402 N4-methylase RsmH